jgi:hypothetical protein
MAAYMPHSQSVEAVPVGAGSGNDIKGRKVYQDMPADPACCLMLGTCSIRKR